EVAGEVTERIDHGEAGRCGRPSEKRRRERPQDREGRVHAHRRDADADDLTGQRLKGACGREAGEAEHRNSYQVAAALAQTIGPSSPPHHEWCATKKGKGGNPPGVLQSHAMRADETGQPEVEAVER